MPEDKPGAAAGHRADRDDYDRAHVPMSEEFDRAKWTLPPLGIVVIVLAVLAVIVGLVAWGTRPQPAAAGSIDNVFAVPTSDGKVMVTMQVTLRNAGKKPLYVKSANASVKTENGEFQDEAANASDFDRYFQAYPALKEHTIKPLRVETKLPVGLEDNGSLIVAFPITPEQFDKRQSLAVNVLFYDQAPLTLTQGTQQKQ